MEKCGYRNKRIIFNLLSTLIILTHCSFDSKSGIWKNKDSQSVKKNVDRFKDFEKLYAETETFNSIVKPSSTIKILLDPNKRSSSWTDEYYQSTNNPANFRYSDLNNLVFKSKKLSKFEIKKKFLYDNGDIIISDIKGNIIVYSLEKESIIYKYNFYKKKFKKINKDINFIIEDGVLFVTDNLGYFYALDYKNEKLLWARNFKIPFRSNLKIQDKIIIASNQDNTINILNKFTGETLRSIPTEKMVLKNDFKNSLAILRNNIFFLNTYGSLYSIEPNKLKIKWFINLNQSLELVSDNLFYSNPILGHKENVVISTDPYLYILNANSGATIKKIPITSIFQPLISGNNLFLITKDNLLVCIKLDNGKILYSLDIAQKIAEHVNSKKKTIFINSFSVINDQLFVFLKNSYLVKFTKIGRTSEIIKLPTKLNSQPIFIEEKILFINNKNNLVIID